MIKITLFIITLIGIVILTSVASAENECYKTLDKCGLISIQQKTCLSKPFREYKKNAKSTDDLLKFAEKEYNFFNSLNYGFLNDCELYANHFIIGLIESLLSECVKSDSSYIFSAKMLLAKSHLNWGQRGRDAIKKDQFYKENYNEDKVIAVKISHLKNVNTHFENALENIECVFNNANENDSILKCQIAVLMYHIYNEYSKNYEDISSLYRNAPVHKEWTIEEKKAYKDTLLICANVELEKSISLIDEFLSHEEELNKHIIMEIDEIKKRYNSLKKTIIQK